MDSVSQEQLAALLGSMAADVSALKDALMAASLATITAERITDAHNGESAAEDRKYRDDLISQVEMWDFESTSHYASAQLAFVDGFLGDPAKHHHIVGLTDALLEERAAWTKVIDLLGEVS